MDDRVIGGLPGSHMTGRASHASSGDRSTLERFGRSAEGIRGHAMIAVTVDSLRSCANTRGSTREFESEFCDAGDRTGRPIARRRGPDELP